MPWLLASHTLHWLINVYQDFLTLKSLHFCDGWAPLLVVERVNPKNMNKPKLYDRYIVPSIFTGDSYFRWANPNI
jgi:hypothetical protein